MATSTISIEVDAESAKAYAAAPADEKRKLQILLGLRLRELMTSPPRSLQAIMDDIGAEAEARGMSPDVLNSLLRHD